MKSENPSCVGIGLVALDVLLSDNPDLTPQYFAGGSCGNVLTILSFLGWQTYPIARLRNDHAGDILLQDLKRFAVHDNLISLLDDGSTPIIIHRVLKDKEGKPKHRFEFRDPTSGKYLPSYKPVLSSSVEDIMQKKPLSTVLYLDRVSRSSIDIAKRSRENGSYIFFEPSSIKDDNQTKECLTYADIVKFSHDRIKNYDNLFPICNRKLEIMTLGPGGLQYRTFGQQNWKQLDGFQISYVVDAAGAGDWCTAGIIFKLFEVEANNRFQLDNIEESLQFGQALGALNCGFLGARGLMYSMNKDFFFSQLSEFLITFDDSIFSYYSLNYIKEPSKSSLNLVSLYS